MIWASPLPERLQPTSKLAGIAHRYYVSSGSCVSLCPANFYVGKDGYTCTACPSSSTNPYPNKNNYCLCPGECRCRGGQLLAPQVPPPG